MQKWGFWAIFSRLAHLIDIFGIIMPRKGFVVDIVNFDWLENAWIFSLNIISRINGCLYVWKPIFLSFYSTHGTPFDLGTLISEVHINHCLLHFSFSVLLLSWYLSNYRWTVSSRQCVSLALCFFLISVTICSFRRDLGQGTHTVVHVSLK